MKTKDRFYKRVDQLFSDIKIDQNDMIEHAAKETAKRILNGASLHFYDTGHIIDSEFINRAGGFVLSRRFKINVDIDSKARHRENKEDVSLEGLAKIALLNSNVYKGDVMIIGSVSGKTPVVVDLALACKALGIFTIAVTSLEYSSQLESEHSSNKRLYEIADVVIDNHAPFGDAMLEVDGVDQNFIPASGLAAAYIMWAFNADLLDELILHGVKPGILGSVNKPKNRKYNEGLEEDYVKTGF